MNSRWIIGVIVASLALNLALIGFIIGKQASPPPDFDVASAYPRWARTLPETRRDELRPLVRKHLRALRPRNANMRKHTKAIAEALKQEPYDSVALIEVLKQMRSELDQTRDLSHASFVEFVSQLSVEERQRLAADMLSNRNMSRHRPRHPREEGRRVE
jgi:uncharacterized membrane protein